MDLRQSIDSFGPKQDAGNGLDAKMFDSARNYRYGSLSSAKPLGIVKK